jgi:hypothetical protein
LIGFCLCQGKVHHQLGYRADIPLPLPSYEMTVNSEPVNPTIGRDAHPFWCMCMYMCIPQTGCSRTIQASGVCRRDQFCQRLVLANCFLKPGGCSTHSHSVKYRGCFSVCSGDGMGIGGKLFARTETHGNMEVELVFDPREQPTHNGRLDRPRDETVRCLWVWLADSVR